MTALFAEHLRVDVPLSRYTSWRVGGSARRLFLPASINDLALFLQKMPYDEALYFLGLGSNTLIRDGGITGTVVLMQGSGLQSLSRISDTVIRAEAGVSCAKLARFAAREDLGGMAFLSGVPGTVGGALMMNAGAHGGETWDYVVSVETLDRKGRFHERGRHEFESIYRGVRGPLNEYFVAANFEHEKTTKSVALDKIKSLLAHRQATQPINQPNGGSVFRNPEGDYAARLIESCGLKGERLGGVWVSEKHANFIVHDGQASAKDIEHLIHLIIDDVLSKTGVTLSLEVKIVGRNDID